MGGVGAVELHAEVLGWVLKAQADVVVLALEVAQISCPIRMLLDVDIPHCFLKYC